RTASGHWPARPTAGAGESWRPARTGRSVRPGPPRSARSRRPTGARPAAGGCFSASAPEPPGRGDVPLVRWRDQAAVEHLGDLLGGRGLRDAFELDRLRDALVE